MKNINRRVILRRRNRLSATEIKEKSDKIKQILFNSKEYRQANIVMFYVSFGSEVDTWDMIKESLEEKKVCVPCVIKDRLVASKIASPGELSKKNVYGICEPEKIKEVSKDVIGLVIVPGVVFDKHNHRIGYGKGYYDDFLKEFSGKKIGLAFELQVLEDIPRDDWDIRLDKVISEG
ncbi:MAG TPA: 5-formyltetrahydrofolate cyclo-ligase [Candidatus Nanoarchaeia archaeon]|nr:5-formyltetrahydrofolate cyclo-ligase [Candidatus Nanoarchaeia archaeon]